MKTEIQQQAMLRQLAARPVHAEVVPVIDDEGFIVRAFSCMSRMVFLKEITACK